MVKNKDVGWQEVNGMYHYFVNGASLCGSATVRDTTSTNRTRTVGNTCHVCSVKTWAKPGREKK